MLERCKACRGKKKVIGLGLIEKNCSTCNGQGRVPVKTVVEVTKQDDGSAIVKKVRNAKGKEEKA